MVVHQPSVLIKQTLPSATLGQIAFQIRSIAPCGRQLALAKRHSDTKRPSCV